MPSFLSICLVLLKFAIATTNVIQELLIELHNAVEGLRNGQNSPLTLSTEDKSSDQSFVEPSNSGEVNAEPVASSTQSSESSDFAESFSTTNSGTESAVLSEPNNPTNFAPLRKEPMPSALRSPLKSQEDCQNTSVGFFDKPLLTKKDRTDSMEKIELVIKPTCEFIPPEVSIFPQMPSQFSSPSLTDSDTPENIKYIEKASRLLTVYTQPKQEYCDINSSTTEFPVSSSLKSSTDKDDAIESENLPKLYVESPSSTENDTSPSKECNSQSSVRFVLPDSHIERESKGFRRESKFRKQPNETSTSEEENEAKISRKRRASPGKFCKSPKKFAETASKIRRYKLSPRNRSDEEHEEMLCCENTSATRSLDFGIRQKSENATGLLISQDHNLKSEELSPRTIEDHVDEGASFQQATLKSGSMDNTFSKSDSISETTSSVRVGDDIDEGAAEFSPEIVSEEPKAFADCLVDSDEKGSLSAPEGKQVFLSFANETFAFQEIAVDSKADFTVKGDASNNCLVEDSTYSDKSCDTSLTDQLKLVDTNTFLQESKLPENKEFISDKNNEKRINEHKNDKLESTLNILSFSESEQNSTCNVQLETTDQASNDDNSKQSETLPSEKLSNKMCDKDSCHEGAKDLASHLENKTEREEIFSNSDRNEDKTSPEDKSESHNFSTSNNSTDQNLLESFTLEADTDNFKVLKETSHQINTTNVDNINEMGKTFGIDQSKMDDVELMEVSSSSSHPVMIDSQSKDQNPETEQQAGEISYDTQNASSLSLLSRCSNREVDEQYSTSKAAGEISDYQFSNLNSNLKKLNFSKSFFTPVLEQLLQRFESVSRSNSPTKTLSSLELHDRAEASLDIQNSTNKTDLTRAYNAKKYFDIVLEELVQQVKSTTVSNSFKSFSDEDSRVPKSEVQSNSNTQTFPLKDLIEVEKASIVQEMEIVLETVHSDISITDAEKSKRNSLDFELHIVPQPVPCETAIAITVENLISNKISSDQSEIKIIDSKIFENEFNTPNITPAEFTICSFTADQEKGDDAYCRSPAAAVSKESITVESLQSNDNFNSSMSSTIKALVELTEDDSTLNTFAEMARDNFTENAVYEVTKEESAENSHLKITNECTEKALIEVTREFLTDYTSVEETNELLTKNALVETAKEDSTGCKLVEVSKNDPEENDNAETANCFSESTLVNTAKCDSTENIKFDVVKDDLRENNFDIKRDCSIERNVVDTSANLDSSVAEEAGDNDKEESSNENKPWKKKQRKSKKKRRN